MLPSLRSVPPPGPSSPARAATVEIEELRLVGRIGAGEMQAFEALYRLYHPRLTRFLDRMTRRPALVDEALNDTFLVVWHGACGFGARSKVSTWIFGIAYRKALKALRRFDVPLADEEADAPIEPGPEQRCSDAELKLVLLRTLDRLSPEHRAVVDLAYFHGLDYREIAEVADCPVNTVKTRMFYARRQLKALLPGPREDWL